MGANRGENQLGVGQHCRDGVSPWPVRLLSLFEDQTFGWRQPNFGLRMFVPP